MDFLPKYGSKVAVCCSFYSDKRGLERLLESTDEFFRIFVDGRWKSYPGKTPLSEDGARELIQKSHDCILIDNPDLQEYQKRNKYIELAKKLGFDYCLVLDSDEYLAYLDYDEFVSNLGENLTYTIPQLDENDGINRYNLRLHSTKCYHYDRHNSLWFDLNPVDLSKNPIINGVLVEHDKQFRDKKRETINQIYYEKYQIR